METVECDIRRMNQPLSLSSRESRGIVLLIIPKAKLRKQRYFEKSLTCITHIVKEVNVLHITRLHSQKGSLFKTAHFQKFEKSKVTNPPRNILMIAYDVVATLNQNILACNFPPDPIFFFFYSFGTVSHSRLHE
jgi:hypothetical protein